MVSDRVYTFQNDDMIIAININEKRIKSNRSLFGFLEDLTTVVFFCGLRDFQTNRVVFLVGCRVSRVKKKSVCFLGGENLRRSVNSFGEKITRCSYHP